MNLKDLAREIELRVVNHEHGWGTLINYTHRNTNTTISDIKAMCQDGAMMETNEKHDTVEDGMVFYSVELAIRPVRGDKVFNQENNTTWYVERMLGTNPYDIVCVGDVRHLSKRSGRREM